MTRPSRMCQLLTRVLLRLLQFSSSLVAYASLQTAAVTYQQTAAGSVVVVGISSRAMSFASLTNFLAMVYAFAFLVFIEWLRLCARPLRFCEQVLDFVALAFLAIASLVLALSDVTLHCRAKYGLVLHCGDLDLAVAASFLSTLGFLVLLLLSICWEDAVEDESEARRLSIDYDDFGGYNYYGRPLGPVTPVPAPARPSTSQETGEPPVVIAQSPPQAVAAATKT
ncbi:hypothetical protein BBJ28_00025298 [Nothophytophthora sp. Chile5]|nr:hypothetical protein BBJ28_00025298 [Nothophytophthora sp. Chile5]